MPTAEARALREKRGKQRDVIAITVALIGVGLAIWSQTGVRSALDQNSRDTEATAAAVVATCQTGNRTRPQIQVNGMVQIDSALEALSARDPEKGLVIRRIVARAEVKAIQTELAVGRSVGFRDCTGNERIDRGDFAPDEAPPPGWEVGIPELLGPDGLPHVTQP
jgi:hypothetical protein